MAKRKTTKGKAGENVVDYRHKTVTRLNIPPAGLVVDRKIKVQSNSVDYNSID